MGTGLHIRADGATILGRPEVAEPGLYVAAGGFVGVDDGVDVRREAIPRPGERGEFDLSVLSGARVVSLDLIALAESVAGLRAQRARLKRIGQGGGRFTVVFGHLDQFLSGTARRGGQTLFKDSGIHETGLLRATAFVQWVFPDPLLFDGMESTARATAVDAFHWGDAPVAPFVDVYGPFPGGYTITAAGLGSLTVTTALGAGQVETVDIGASRVYRGGVRQMRAISVPGRWEIPAGRVVPHTITGPGGSGSMVVRTPNAHE